MRAGNKKRRLRAETTGLERSRRLKCRFKQDGSQLPTTLPDSQLLSLQQHPTGERVARLASGL